MIWNREEVKFIQTAAKWFKENKALVRREDAIRELRIDDITYETLLKKMEYNGVVGEIKSVDGKDGYAIFFRPTPHAEELAREIEAKQSVSPDIIDQLKKRIRQNPITAWLIIIFISLASVITLVNQLWDLIAKFVK